MTLGGTFQEYTFHISATKYKLLETAEDIELVKEDARGVPREFTVADLDDYLTDDRTIDSLLNMADRQTIVLHELENIRALDYEKFIPGLFQYFTVFLYFFFLQFIGYPLYRLYENQAIVPFVQNCQLITKIYPLHDQEELKKLAGKWYIPKLVKQPIGKD